MIEALGRSTYAVALASVEQVSPNGWKGVELGEEVGTAEDRLSAILNCAKKPALALMILEMPSPGDWLSYSTVGTSLNQEYGKKFIDASNVRHDLGNTAEQFGVAVSSDIDSNDWRLTEFGIKMKAALIFIWKKTLELDSLKTELMPSDRRTDFTLTPTSVFGIVSRITIDEEGNNTTPTQTRGIILAALKASRSMQIVELKKPTGRTSRKVSQHAERLHAIGLVEKKSVTTNEGELVVYINPTEEGRSLVDWPIFIDSRGVKQMKNSREVHQAVVELAKTKRDITLSEILDAIRQANPQSRPQATRVSAILKYYADPEQGLVTYKQFHHYELSSVSLTPFGDVYVDRVLVPLAKWSIDPNSVAEIKEIEAELARNPNAFPELRQRMATIFRSESTRKNLDRSEETAAIQIAIKEHSGEYGLADVHRATGVSPAITRKIIRSLETDRIIGIKSAPKGNKKILYYL